MKNYGNVQAIFAFFAFIGVVAYSATRNLIVFCFAFVMLSLNLYFSIMKLIEERKKQKSKENM